MRWITVIRLLILCAFCLGINWHVAEGGIRQERPNNINKLCIVPQRNLILGNFRSKSNGSIRIWSIDDGVVKEILDLGDRVFVASLAVSNNGDLIAVSLLGKKDIACYSLADRKWLWKTAWVEEGITGAVIQFNKDDRKIIVVGHNNIVTYDTLTGSIVNKQEDSKAFSNGFPAGRTRNNGISPSARFAAFWQGYPLAHGETRASSGNIWVLVYDIEMQKIISKQGKIQDKYKNCSAAFTPDEKNLALGSTDGYVRIWSISEQKVIKQWRAYEAGEEPVPYGRNPSYNSIESISFSPDGEYLATMGHLRGGFGIRIWDYATSRLIREFTDVTSSPLIVCSGYPMAFSPDRKYFAFEQQGRLCLYDTQTWQEKWCVSSDMTKD